MAHRGGWLGRRRVSTTTPASYRPRAERAKRGRWDRVKRDEEKEKRARKEGTPGRAKCETVTHPIF